MTRGGGALGSRDREILLDADQIIGVDEVGRGALAGPVVVCAVAFGRIPDDGEVRDSKLLTANGRERIAARLREVAGKWAACEIWPEMIDRFNILEATRLAMAAVARPLVKSRTVVVTDALDPGEIGCRVVAVTKADRDYFCVAAASILAKVHRDRLMVDLGRRDPRWQWERNKGYGTEAHRRALTSYGPGTLHRQSFTWSRVLP